MKINESETPGSLLYPLPPPPPVPVPQDFRLPSFHKRGATKIETKKRANQPGSSVRNENPISFERRLALSLPTSRAKLKLIRVYATVNSPAPPVVAINKRATAFPRRDAGTERRRGPETEKWLN